jgi:hypothetical protein
MCLEVDVVKRTYSTLKGPGVKAMPFNYSCKQIIIVDKMKRKVNSK